MKTVGDLIVCTNIYTGARHARKIIHISKGKTKFVVERADWKTGKAEFTFRKDSEIYKNDYSGEIFALGSTT